MISAYGLTMLNNFDIQNFLTHYWQKKPLLIKQGLPDFKSPLTPDEMAGLACEPDIESRIIIEADNQWTAENGPFEENRFSQLPEKDWTLLVQAVDHYIPEVAALLDDFRFIPNWRIDDVMISYAVTGGNVGPHYDNYDVFLIQGAGKREWKLGQLCGPVEALQDNPAMRLLETFNEVDSWILEPGDILYLPPLYAHWGTGLDNDCMTFSVGFRAPSIGELLANFCDERLSQLNDNLRYADADLNLQQNPGEIQAEAIDKIQGLLLEQFSDKQLIAEWFGRYMTDSKYEQEQTIEQPYSLKDLQQALESPGKIARNPSKRFAYLTIDEKTAILFIDGHSYSCSGALAQQLSNQRFFLSKELKALLENKQDASTIIDCFNQDYLYFDD